jgi:hypothetical protein
MAGDINNEWVKLILPMEFEEQRQSKTIIFPDTNGKIWQDPRCKDGELLSKNRFSLKEINRYKHDLGSYGYAGQYQQRPAPLGGGILQKHWFKKWTSPYLPKFDYIIQSWDTAISDAPTAAYSACTTLGENPRYIVTNLLGEPEDLYDKVYCVRGDMENRIKEQQLELFADRTESIINFV